MQLYHKKIVLDSSLVSLGLSGPGHGHPHSEPLVTICHISPGVDLIAAFYGCLYCGCVPVTVRPPHPQNLGTTLPTVKMIVEVCILWVSGGRP